MEVVIAPVPELARIAADTVESVLRKESAPVLGLATGSTPLPLYDELVRRHVEEGLTFAHATAFLLDEYVGLPEGHPESYRAVIDRELAHRVDLRPEAVHALDGRAADPLDECADFERRMAAAGGVDVQILGVGSDGHIAFNEPTSSLTSRTRVMALVEQTRRDNARFFGGDVDAVPRLVMTQGIGTILEARRLVLIATGEAKAEAVRQVVEGAVSARWPATAVQMHPHVLVLVDEAAASRLELADEYKQAWAMRPEWLPI